MLQRFRERFGTAGLIVGVLALVVALAGTAFAASGALTAQQKKEVKKIAGQVSKPGPQGPTGVQGPQGNPGANGKDGANGSRGADGVSVTSTESGTTIDGSHCVGVGGSKFVSASGATYACNGKSGETGFTEVLPKNKTETGTWGGVAEEGVDGGFGAFPVPFNIPLLAAPTPVFVGTTVAEKDQGKQEGCPGVEGGLPTAEPGKLCVYVGFKNGTLSLVQITDPNSEFGAGASPAGALVLVQCSSKPCILYGTYAVTAP